MKIYQVNVKEVHIQPHVVRAKSVEEARVKVEEGEGLMVEDWFEYSHTIEPEEWVVYSEDDDSNLKDFDKDLKEQEKI